MRYFRQIVPQVFFRARASILKWKMLVRQRGWCGDQSAPPVGEDGTQNARTSSTLEQDDTSTRSKVNAWWKLDFGDCWQQESGKQQAAHRRKCAVKVGKSSFNGGATCPAADRYRCPNSTWSPHAPVTQNRNLLSTGCLFYPDLNSTLFLRRFDSVSGETVNRSKESITALLYSWKLKQGQDKNTANMSVQPNKPPLPTTRSYF